MLFEEVLPRMREGECFYREKWVKINNPHFMFFKDGEIYRKYHDVPRATLSYIEGYELLADDWKALNDCEISITVEE